MSLTAFAERYRKWCKRHGYNFSQSKAVEVHAGAQDLIAMLPRDALTKTMVRQAIDALNAISASMERLKAEMQALAAQLPEYPVVIGHARRRRFSWPSARGGARGCDPVYPPKRHYRFRGC